MSEGDSLATTRSILNIQPMRLPAQPDCWERQHRLCLAVITAQPADSVPFDRNQLSALSSPVTDEVRQSKHWTLPELGSDTLGVVAGLTTRTAMSELCPLLTRGPMPAKLAGLGLQLFMAGATKDLSADGHLGDWQDIARGGGVYAGSLLLLKGLSLSPTRQIWDVDVARAIHNKFPMAYPMPANRNQVVQQLSSQIPRSAGIKELLNPRNLNPFNRHLWNAELAADALAHGEISLAKYVAQTRYGHGYLVLSTTSGFGAGREYLYLATEKKQ